MVARSLAPQKITLNINLFVVSLFVLLAGCQQNGGEGITIAQNDGTAPTLVLGASQPGGQEVTQPYS